VETICEEPFPPAADHLTAAVEARCDFVVVQSLGSHQDHLGALDLKVWQRIFAGSPLQFGLFGRRQAN